MQQDVRIPHLALKRILVVLLDNNCLDIQRRDALPQPGTGVVLQYRLHLRRHPAKGAVGRRAASMRSPSFHFAMRSERAKEPTFSCPASQPTARCTIVTSSVSPERAETMVRQPAARAAINAALVS